MSIFDEQLVKGKNVFIPLEALSEHIGGTWLELHRLGRFTGEQYQHIWGHDAKDYPLSSPEYHLAAIERYAHEVFQLLAAMLPALYAESESDKGYTDPTVIARIMAAARERAANPPA